MVILRLQVIGTYDSGGIIFLNSSCNYETDFTAIIITDDEKYFLRRAIDPVDDYDGKVIEVTGELQEYDGPEIVLYHPYQVDIIG